MNVAAYPYGDEKGSSDGEQEISSKVGKHLQGITFSSVEHEVESGVGPSWAKKIVLQGTAWSSLTSFAC